jgi:tight adherence protein C
MTYSVFGQVFALGDWLALFGMILLFGGGLIMIASGSMRMRDEQLSRRLALAHAGAGAAADGRQPHAPADSGSSAAGMGVSEPEHRQIVRMVGRLGVPADWALSFFTAARAALALGAGAIVMLYFALESQWITMAIAAAAAILGWFLPMKIVRRRLKSHAKSVGAGLPSGLELIAICVEAGLSLENGLQRVARELKGTEQALADELALTWAEITILPSRDQALANMAERVDLPSVRSVVGTLAQSMRYGSPLAQSLRNAAEEMRTEQLMALEERANRLPALMTVPVMLFIMPTIFLIVGGPAVLRLLDIFTSGN